MQKFFFAFAIVFSTGIAQGSTSQIAASTRDLDYGVVAGAFAKKPKKVNAGGVTYHVIAPDLIEPACNSTQIIVWVEDPTLEGDAGGIAYNLGVQASSLESVSAEGDELKITYHVNDQNDCSFSVPVTVYLKYTGAGNPLEVRE